MEAFSALLVLCAGNSPVTGEFPAQRPVRPSFDIFFDLCLNKQLSKQSWGWWFETPSRSLWRHYNELDTWKHISMQVQSKRDAFHSAKYALMSSEKWRPFCRGFDVLMGSCHVFNHIFQGCFTGIGEIAIALPQFLRWLSCRRCLKM